MRVALVGVSQYTLMEYHVQVGMDKFTFTVGLTFVELYKDDIFDLLALTDEKLKIGLVICSPGWIGVLEGVH